MATTEKQTELTNNNKTYGKNKKRTMKTPLVRFLLTLLLSPLVIIITSIVCLIIFNFEQLVALFLNFYTSPSFIQIFSILIIGIVAGIFVKSFSSK